MDKSSLRGRRTVLFTRSATGDNDQLDRQRRVLRRHAKKNGMVVVDEVRFSGLGDVMSELIQPLLDRKSVCDDFDAVLVADFTRFTRGGVSHGAYLLMRLKEAGIDVATVQNGLIHSSNDVAFLFLCANLLGEKGPARDATATTAEGASGGPAGDAGGHMPTCNG